jgi:class 3 adenylate cyclase/predicted ATPase
MDVGTWLRGVGLGQYEQAFRDNDVDDEVLPDLTAEDLIGLGVASIGHRRKLLAAIAALRAGLASADGSSPQAGPASAAAAVPAPKPSEAERRQLTVMFVDIVGSTSMAVRLDPEDMSALLRAYQNAVAGGVTRFGGHIAKFMGDGVLAYFGWPKAHEDATERAVRAALTVIEAVGRITAQDAEPIAVRIGIATGLVLVGDLIGQGAAQEEVVVGETPNLAARLQELGEPDTIVIAEGTHRLLGGLFKVRDLGSQQLRGFGQPVRAWRILESAMAESRFEALHSGELMPLVGREQELALLLDRWALARVGEGQVVLLSGEPGIGKSRIVRALHERLWAEPRTSLRYHCSPYHGQSALWPVIRQLERAAGFARDDGAAAKAAKLEILFREVTARVSDALPLVADLLSIPLAGNTARHEMSSQQRKARTFAALLAQLEALAAERPVLIMLEDAHWIDPTTLELFDQTVERIQRLPVLLVVTFRPEFTPSWTGYAHATLLGLNRLEAHQVAAIVECVTGGKALPAEVLGEILAKTDGVPLFVEELTKAVLELGLLREDDGRYVLDGPLPPLAIPDTLQGSLLARLDRLAPVKEVAQIGAVIGREFGHELLAAVAPLDEAALDDAMRQLVAAELVFRRGEPPETTYIFKHALVQDAAYASLLRSRRQQLHARVARVLEARFPVTVTTAPEILAHHLTEAGMGEDAATYWLAAGRQAVERSANKEATAHLRRGLELLRKASGTPSRDALELDLLLTLGPVLFALHGYAVPEAEAVYTRAHELSRPGGGPQWFVATWGLWIHNQMRADFGVAAHLAQELLGFAQDQHDKGFALQAHHAAWTTALNLPDLQACHEHCERGMALYDAERHRAHKFVYAGHDPGMCSRMNDALALWLLGRPVQALERAEEGLALASRLAHPFSEAQALAFAASLHHFRREPGPAAVRAEAAAALAVQQGVAPHFAAMARIIEGWSLVMRQHVDEGRGLAHRGLDELRSLQLVLRLPYLISIAAECDAAAGQQGEALGTLEAGFEVMRRTGERRWEAEMHRLHGQFLLGTGEAGREEAEACFLRALAIARSQGARSLELRAATLLAYRWAERRRKEAQDLLTGVYEQFTEGFDTPDLQEAGQLVEALS